MTQISYALNFPAGTRNRTVSKGTPPTVPRIARLMALAIRFDAMLREGKFRDYSELAWLGRVTRARMTQIMQLLDLAPDLQEQILFLPPIDGLNERNLRPILRRIDWDQQRRLFAKIAGPANGPAVVL
jgi:hypothetical protein